MKNKGLIIAVLAIALITLGWWFGKEKNQQNDDKQVVKIGVIMPLSGPVAEPGNNAFRGIELATENFNNNNQEIKIELIVEDSKSSPKDGVNAINKLIKVDNVKIVIGDIMSSVFLACAPIAESNKVVMFSPGASAPEVRNAGDYIFRNYLSDDFDGKVMANYISGELNIKNVGIISVNNDYGIGINKTFFKEMQKINGIVSFNEQYSQGETNFRTILSKIKNKKFDAIYLVSNPSESGFLVKQIKELGINTKLFGNLVFENNEFINTAKGSFDEIIFSAPYFDINASNEVTRTFKSDYEKRYNSQPDVAAALGYDVVLILLHTLKENNYDVSGVKDGLYKLKDFEGVTGNTSFDYEGDVMKDIYIKKINKNADIEILKIFRIDD